MPDTAQPDGVAPPAGSALSTLDRTSPISRRHTRRKADSLRRPRCYSPVALDVDVSTKQPSLGPWTTPGAPEPDRVKSPLCCIGTTNNRRQSLRSSSHHKLSDR